MPAPAGLDGIDSMGLVGATLGLPEQIEAAVAASSAISGLPDHVDVEHIVFLGVGDAAVAAELVAAVASPFMAVPTVVCRDFSPPAFVSEGTLCFALSKTGDTEETLEAAQAAAVAGARVVVIAGGGELVELGHSWLSPVIRVPNHLPCERVALGALAVPAMLALEQVGLWRGAGEWVARGVTQLRARRARLTGDDNLARGIARTIGRTMPIIYGGGEIGAAAAHRWKAQVNLNAKVAAFANSLPDLAHGEIAGWGQNGDVTRQVFTIVQLRHDHEHPQVMARFDHVRQLTDEVVHEIIEVEAEGDGTLAQALDLIFIGDLVSLYLAMGEGTDPGPVPAIEFAAGSA